MYMVYMIWHRVHKQSQGTFAVKEEDCRACLIVNGVEAMTVHVKGTFVVEEEDCKVFLMVNGVEGMIFHERDPLRRSTW